MTLNLDNKGLSSIVSDFDLFFIDIWGVLHNGISLNEGSVDVLNNLDQILNCILVMQINDSLIINRLSNRRSCKDCNQIFNLLYDPPKKAGKCNFCMENSS